jgi:hypothetical protein
MQDSMNRGRLTARSIISRHDAVKEIAERIGRPDETEKESANRVSHLVGYALKQGHLATQPNGGFILGEVVAWARDKWPGRFTDLPAVVSDDVLDGIVCRDFMDMVVLPATLEKCHAQINQQHHQIAELSDALQAAKTEFERLRADAMKWWDLCEKNRINGGKR